MVVPSRRYAIGWVSCAAMLVQCVPTVDNPYEYTLDLRVVDERGEAIVGARVEVEERVAWTNARGQVEVDELLGPVRVRVSAPAHLDEPLALDRSDAARGPLEVRLFAREGPSGQPRWSMHLGGDTMLGRRYLEPPEGLPVVPGHDIAGAARRVVDDLAPLFAAADLGIVNLETVVGEVDESLVYPAKRFILKMPAEGLAAFDELSVDLVTLANNHTRDYKEAGIVATLASLDARGLPHVGASLGPGSDDGNPYVLEPVAGSSPTLAVFSFTTVDGDFVNDNYALADEPAPPECSGGDAPPECFMYDARSWGCSAAAVEIPVATRRAGPAWQLFSAAEASMSEAEAVACWSSLEAVYPEMQDWTARRGHGGAAPWTDETTAAIAAADAEHDIVMIQLHAGFQFQAAASSGVKKLARDAIDAGADIVIAHHPHVLQGIEWYRGKLIVHSLGNLIFDQDFMATFTTGYLRTVWEGSTLLEASLVPVELVGYRPIPVTGEAARRAAALLWELSSTSAYADRDAQGDVRRYFSGAPEPHTSPGHVRLRHNAAILRDAPPPELALEVELAAGERVAELDFEGLVHAQSGGDVQLGRDLFGWGHLEDALADDEIRNAAQWFIPSDGSHDPVLRLDPRAPNGFGWVELYRNETMSGDTFVRPHGRLNVPEYRLWLDTPQGAVPGEAEAEYTMRLHARQHGEGRPYVRLELFEFDDTDPTEDPTTIPIGGPVDIPFEVPADGQWHDVDVEIDPALFWVGELRANVVLVRIRFAPPELGESVLALDDFAFIEWRAAGAAQDHYGDYRYLRSASGGPASFTVAGVPLRDE